MSDIEEDILIEKIDILRKGVHAIYRNDTNIRSKVPLSVLQVHNDLVKNNEINARKILESRSNDEDRIEVLKEEISRLKKVTEKQTMWEIVMSTRIKTEGKPVVLPSYPTPLTIDSLKIYIEEWRVILNQMPEIEEKKQINDNLLDFNNHAGSIDADLSKRLIGFNTAMQNNIFLFQKIDSRVEFLKLKGKAEAMITPLKNMLKKSDVINQKEKAILQGYIEMMSTALSSKEDYRINKVMSYLQNNYTLDEITSRNNPVTKKEEKLINTIKKEIEKLEKQIVKKNGHSDNKQQKVNVLKATILYIRNNDSDALVKVLESNVDFDKKSMFSPLSEAKRLVGRACVEKKTSLKKLMTKPVEPQSQKIAISSRFKSKSS